MKSLYTHHFKQGSMIKIYSILLLSTMFFPAVSLGEVIELNNGDSLNVIIKKQTKDRLIVEHTSLASNCAKSCVL